MKKITLLTLFLFGVLQCSFGQVGVSVNFNGSTTFPTGWTNPTGFFTALSTAACEGNSIRTNLWGSALTASFLSPNYVAGSNGTDITFSFDYKVVEYGNTTTPTPAGWGNLFVESSSDNGVTWLVNYTISTANHIVAGTCANVAFSIPASDVPSGSDLKFRFRGVRTAGDYYIYLDNILISQETSLPPNCDALLVTPAINSTVANLSGNLSWTSATGVATGYNVSVGSSPGGSDIYPVTNVGNVTTKNIGALTAATTYYVSIVPYNLNGDAVNCTDYSFTTFAPITNDDCSGAIALTVNPAITCDVVTQATVQGATASSTNAATCLGTEDDDVWFSFVATDIRHKISLLNVTGTSTDMVHSVWKGADCSALTLMPNSCFDDNISVVINLTVGETYYIRVYTSTATPNQDTSFNICVTTLPVANIGSLCTNPIIVDVLPYTIVDNTTNYEDLNYEGSPGATGCGTTSTYLNGNDVVYSYTPTSNGSIKIDMDTTGTWSGLFVYTSCAAIGTGCVAGAANSFASGVTIPTFTVVAGTTYYMVISTWPAPQTIPYTLTITENSCTNPIATYTAVSNCPTTEEFSVNVNVTSLGSANSLTISDGSTTQNVSVTGVVTFGPYTLNTPKTFVTTNDQDATCFITSPVQNLVACPPVNNNCAAAVDLVLGANYASGKITTSTIGATLSPELPFPAAGFGPTDSCGGLNFATNGKDIWYKITVPASGSFTVQTLNGVLPFTDTALQLYSGTCTSFVVVTCNDDTVAPAPVSNFSLLTVTGRTPGEVLYLRVYGYNGTSGTFDLSVFDASLTSNTFDNTSFSFYPNPVVDILNLSYSKNIDKVQVINLIGQEVIAKAVNSTDANVDMSALASGTYLVKVTSDNQIKTIKVIKQ